MIRRWLLCALAMLPVVAAAAAPAGLDSRQPVEISADRMEADDAAKTVVFTGNAVAKQKDIIITGDRLTIHTPSKGGDVERMVAEGNVRIVQGRRTATGARAEYFRAEERIVLSGSPRVTDGENTVQGHEIVFFVKENRSVVKSGQDGRVNAVFQPKGEAGR